MATPENPSPQRQHPKEEETSQREGQQQEQQEQQEQPCDSNGRGKNGPPLDAATFDASRIDHNRVPYHLRCSPENTLFCRGDDVAPEKGRHLVATRFIPEGRLILCERPLVGIQTLGNPCLVCHYCMSFLGGPDRNIKVLANQTLLDPTELPGNAIAETDRGIVDDDNKNNNDDELAVVDNGGDDDSEKKDDDDEDEKKRSDDGSPDDGDNDDSSAKRREKIVINRHPSWDFVPCRKGCGYLYCSVECERDYWESRHQFFCTGNIPPPPVQEQEGQTTEEEKEQQDHGEKTTKEQEQNNINFVSYNSDDNDENNKTKNTKLDKEESSSNNNNNNDNNNVVDDNDESDNPSSSVSTFSSTTSSSSSSTTSRSTERQQEEQHPLLRFQQYAYDNNEIFFLVAEWIVGEFQQHRQQPQQHGCLETTTTSPFEDFLKAPWWEVVDRGPHREEWNSKVLQRLCRRSCQQLRDHLLSYGLDDDLRHYFDRVLTPQYLSRVLGCFELNSIAIPRRHPLCRDIFEKDLRYKYKQELMDCLEQAGLIIEQQNQNQGKDEEETKKKKDHDNGALVEEEEEAGEPGADDAKEKDLDNAADEGECHDDDDNNNKDTERNRGIGEEENDREDDDGSSSSSIRTTSSSNSSVSSVSVYEWDLPDDELAEFVSELDYDDDFCKAFPLLDGTVLYSVSCKMNHSCDPNVCVRYRTSGWGKRHPLVALCVATRDISPGEELCISYIDTDPDRAHRQSELDHYGFVCSCTRCLEEKQQEELEEQKAEEKQKEKDKEKEKEKRNKGRRRGDDDPEEDNTESEIVEPKEQHTNNNKKHNGGTQQQTEDDGAPPVSAVVSVVSLENNDDEPQSGDDDDGSTYVTDDDDDSSLEEEDDDDGDGLLVGEAALKKRLKRLDKKLNKKDMECIPPAYLEEVSQFVIRSSSKLLTNWVKQDMMKQQQQEQQEQQQQLPLAGNPAVPNKIHGGMNKNNTNDDTKTANNNRGKALWITVLDLVQNCIDAVQERNFVRCLAVGSELEQILFDAMVTATSTTSSSSHNNNNRNGGDNNGSDYETAYWIGATTASIGHAHRVSFVCCLELLDKAVLFGLPRSSSKIDGFYAYVEHYAMQMVVGPCLPALVATTTEEDENENQNNRAASSCMDDNVNVDVDNDIGFREGQWAYQIEYPVPEGTTVDSGSHNNNLDNDIAASGGGNVVCSDDNNNEDRRHKKDDDNIDNNQHHNCYRYDASENSYYYDPSHARPCVVSPPIPGGSSSVVAAESKKQPRVLRKVAIHWPAITRWSDFMFFARYHGHRLVPIRVGGPTTTATTTTKDNNHLEDNMRQEITTIRTFISDFLLPTRKKKKRSTTLRDAMETAANAATAATAANNNETAIAASSITTTAANKHRKQQQESDNTAAAAAAAAAATIACLAQHPLMDQIPSLLDDIDGELLADLCSRTSRNNSDAPPEKAAVDLSRLRVSMGPRCTRTPLQKNDCHDATTMIQIVGRNYVRIYCDGTETITDDTKYREVVVSPGDAIVIPANTYYYALALSTSISIDCLF